MPRAQTQEPTCGCMPELHKATPLRCTEEYDWDSPDLADGGPSGVGPVIEGEASSQQLVGHDTG